MKSFFITVSNINPLAIPPDVNMSTPSSHVVTEHQVAVLGTLLNSCSDLEERLKALEQQERDLLEAVRQNVLAPGGSKKAQRKPDEDEETAQEREMLADEMATRRHFTDVVKDAQPEGKCCIVVYFFI